MDISELKPHNVSFEVTHPYTDKPIGLSVSLVPKTDEAVTKIINDHSEIRQSHFKDGKELPKSTEERMSAEVYGSRIGAFSWHGDGNWKGKKPKYTLKLAVEMMLELDWFYAQVVREVSKEKAFFSDFKET